MRLSPSLKGLDQLSANALVIFLARDPMPLKGLLSLIDWRLCFNFSKYLLEDRLNYQDRPTIIADLNRLKFGPIFLFPCEAAEPSIKFLDMQILKALKVLGEAKIENFVFSFPDQYPWVFDHWKKNYESHSVFKNISIFDQCK